MKKKNGFTMIELMVVAIIISIGAVSSLPFITENIMRGQAKDNLKKAEELKPSITEYYNSKGRTFPVDNTELGLPIIDGQFASKITISNGRIIATFGNQANKQFTANEGTRIVLIPHKTTTSFINWECQFQGNENFAPYICKDRGIVYADYIDPITPPTQTPPITSGGAQWKQ